MGLTEAQQEAQTALWCWELIHDVPNEHRFFKTPIREGSVAIADRSGEYPHLCEDETWWLDPTRPILFGERGPKVPIESNFDRDEHNQEKWRSWTTMSMEEAFWILTNVEGFVSKVGAEYYSVQKTAFQQACKACGMPVPTSWTKKFGAGLLSEESLVYHCPNCGDVSSKRFLH